MEANKFHSMDIDGDSGEQGIRGGRKRARSAAADDAVQADMARGSSALRSESLAARSISRVRDRSTMGVRNIKQKVQAENIGKKFQRPANLLAKRGEADRAVLSSKPKHLFTGKRGMGKNDRR
jgi:nucleolar GTP-binding protein